MNTATARRIIRTALKLGSQIIGTDANGITVTGQLVARTGSVTAIVYVVLSDQTGERVALTTAQAVR